MSRVPVTPENPLGLVRRGDIGISEFISSGKPKRTLASCPICGLESELCVFAVLHDNQWVLAGHRANPKWVGPRNRGTWRNGTCPGSRMILEEYQPVTLEDCNRKLDEMLKELEG